MDIADLIDEAFTNSRDHGFHDGEEPGDHNVLGMKLALIHSEVSEALEDVRDRKMDTVYVHKEMSNQLTSAPVDGFSPPKPNGFLSEIADVMIRCGDLIGMLGRRDEFVKVLREKMAYNKSRPFKHGRKC